MATTYELSYFETDAGLTGTIFVYGFDALTGGDVKIVGYIGAAQTDLSHTIADVNTATKTITLSVAPTGYDKIRIYRSTTVLPLVDFTDGAVLSAVSLNTAYKHSLFAAQEVVQGAADTSNNIGTSLVFTANINNGAVTSEKLAADSVDATKLADNCVLEENIIAGAVSTTKLANLAVTDGKLADNSVITAKILDENITASKIANTLDLSAKIITLPNINNPFAKQLLYVVEEVATGVQGGAATATTQHVRKLNTVIESGIAGASLNTLTYQVTLPAGKYFFDYTSPAHKVNASFSFIYQVSPLPAAIIGNGENAYSAGADGTVTTSSGSSILTFTTTTVIELKHYTTAAQAGDGLGVAVGFAGRNERYASLKIWKLA